MSAVPVTAHQLRSKVAVGPPEGARRPGRRAARRRSLGRATASWTWTSGTFAVVRADTVLEVREALADAEAPGAADRRADRAGAGRAGPGRRRPPGPQQALPGRPLGGRQGPLPGRGSSTRRSATAAWPRRCWSTAPPGGEYPPVPAGVLDAATAWRAIFHHAFGMEDREPDLPGAAPLGRRRDRGGPLPRRPRPNSATAAAPAWPRRWGRPPGRSSTSSSAGPARDALGPGRRLRGRLRRGGRRARPPGRRRPAGAVPPQPADPAGRRPAPGPGRPRRDRRPGPRDEPGPAQGHLLRADALLREVQAAPLRPPRPPDAAGLGGAAPPVRRGAGRRRPTPADAAALAAAEDAAPASRRPRARPAGRRTRPVRARTRMALRLARWLRTPDGARGSFAQLAGALPRRGRVRRTGPRDASGRGRRAAPSCPTPTPGLERAVAARRAAFNRAFARRPGRLDPQRLGPRRGPPRRGRAGPGRRQGRWTPRYPVLLVVLDGMSWPVATSCWPTCGGSTGSRRPCRGPPARRRPVDRRDPQRHRALADQPAGRDWLTGAMQDDERRLFPADPAPVACCDRKHPPLLFHKRQLTEGSRGGPARATIWPGDPVAEQPGRRRRHQRHRRPPGRGAADPRHLDGRRHPPARRAPEAGPRLGPGRGPGQRPRPRLAPRPGRHAASPARPARAGGRRRRGPGRRRGPARGARGSGPRGRHRLIAPWAERVRYGAARRTATTAGRRRRRWSARWCSWPTRAARQPGRRSRASPPAGLVGRAGRRRPAARGDRTPRPPARPPRTPAGYLFPRPDPAEAEPVHAPARTPSRGRPAPELDRAAARLAGLQGPEGADPHARPEDEVVRQALAALDRQGGGIMTPAAFARRRRPRRPAGRPDRPHPAAAERGRLRDPHARPRARTASNSTWRCSSGSSTWSERTDGTDQPRSAAARSSTPCAGGPSRSGASTSSPSAWAASSRPSTRNWRPWPRAAPGSRRSGATTAAARRSSAAGSRSAPRGRASPPPRSRSPRPRRRCTGWRRSTAAPWSGSPPPTRFQGAFRSVVDGWFYGLEEDVLAEGRVDPLGRGGAGDGDRRAAGDSGSSAISRATPQFAAALRGYRRPSAEGDHATAEGLIAWLAGPAARRRRGQAGRPGSRGTSTTSPP